MKEEDKWSPETKLWPLVAPLCTHNHSKLSDITAGKLSVESQFITQKPWSLNGLWMTPIVYSWLSQGQEKAETKSKLAILQEYTVCRMKVYWTSSPFLVKSQVWLCVCGSRVMWNLVTYIQMIVSTCICTENIWSTMSMLTWIIYSRRM